MKRNFYIILTIISLNILGAAAHDIATDRNQSIRKGINVSWLEQYWNPDILKSEKLKEQDFELISRLGFRTIRLPVAFQQFYISGTTEQKTSVSKHLAYALKMCKRYKLKLILVNHYGNLRKGHLAEDTQVLISLWQDLEKRYRNISNDALYFELFNEPTIDDKDWRNSALKIIAAIRHSSPARTIIIGASNYNSMYELSRIKPYPVSNLIYTFHFYEPFIFTHQGAAWSGKQVSTTQIPFPYQNGLMPALNTDAAGTPGEINYKNYPNEGKYGAIHDKLQIVNAWAKKYNVPLLCGEYGVYNKYATEQSISNYLYCVRTELDKINVPGIIWDYDENFSFFNVKPSYKSLSKTMLKAIGAKTD
ncbi:glycoside hydrolase family 5 protein [Pedobacter sp. AW1-32]|uniref:glycoside hydrolase family 5 protein n=1 Tax=Pedobacter sp. AW1-32 TaxID=3383026 RepID=UPI003FEF9FDD